MALDPATIHAIFKAYDVRGTVPDQLDEELTEPEPDEIFLVRLTAGWARAFVARARNVVGAGRPDCPFCGIPIDPDGHLCVRANGFRRRETQ